MGSQSFLRQRGPALVQRGEGVGLRILRPAPGQRAGGTGVDTGRDEARPDTAQTAVAFLHLFPGACRRWLEGGARRRDRPWSRSGSRCSWRCRTGSGRWPDPLASTPTGQAVTQGRPDSAGRRWTWTPARRPGFVLIDLAVGLLSLLRVNIVLIHAGDGAGAAGRALFGSKSNKIFMVSASSFFHGAADAAVAGSRNRGRYAPAE